MRKGKQETFRNFPAEHINICKASKGNKSQRFSKMF